MSVVAVTLESVIAAVVRCRFALLASKSPIRLRAIEAPMLPAPANVPPETAAETATTVASMLDVLVAKTFTSALELTVLLEIDASTRLLMSLIASAPAPENENAATPPNANPREAAADSASTVAFSVAVTLTSPPVARTSLSAARM